MSRLAFTVISRIGTSVAILLAVSVITFLLMHLAPGDPVDVILGDGATAEARAELTEELGLDQPLVQRYWQWMGNVLHGDLGESFRSGTPVLESVAERAPVSLQLLIGAQVLALLLAVPTAVVAAYRADGIFDRLTRASSLALLSMPQFLVGILLIYVFSLNLGWLPATGYVAPGESLGGNLRSLLLPCITLALVEFPTYLRLLRSEMIQTLGQNFILTARAVGLAPWRILIGHALRPSSMSLVTALGINIGRMIGGAVIVEVLFGLPGLGQMLTEAIFRREYLEVQGIVLLVATAFVLINLAVDALYSWLDPRVRLREAS